MSDQPAGNPDIQKMRTTVMRWLKQSDRSCRKVRERLLERGDDPVMIEQLIDEFRERGWLDDHRCAEALARRWCRKEPMATGALARRLESEGIDASVAASIAADHEGEEGPTGMALDIARGRLERMNNLDRTAAARRLQGVLARRGFGEDVVLEVLQRLELIDT